MPASRSTARNADRPAQSRKRWRSIWGLILIGALAALIVLATALPASLLGGFMPPNVRWEDLSGTVWHGSAGKIGIAGRDAGAVEWRLHPAALFRLMLDLDVHWVKLGFAVDAAVQVDRHGVTATAVRGGGPIADLRDLGADAGWQGAAAIAMDRLTADWAGITSAAGEIRLLQLRAAALEGANLGDFALVFETPADAAGALTGRLSDLAGPLRLQGTLTLSPRARSGLLSATIQERPAASLALRQAIDGLARLRGRDAQGRVPIDLEFTF